MASTDVREWLRAQGEIVPERGKLSAALQARYDAAHDPAAGVSGADFPAAGGGADDDGAAAAAAPAEPATAEKRPRQVKAKTSGRAGWRGLFSRGGGDPKKKAGRKGPRTSLSDFAEETWQDAAWLFSGMPPVSRLLGYQAPYAGVVFDQSVAGTPVDRFLQPAARHAASYRALNGLFGPPLLTALICAEGRYIADENTGKILVDPATNRPVPDGRTAMLLGMLRYSLLQMAKVSDIHAEEIESRMADTDARMAAVEVLVDSIFGWGHRAPAPPPPSAAPPNGAPPPHPAGGAAPIVPTQVFLYPPKPQMDDTGADPGRS